MVYGTTLRLPGEFFAPPAVPNLSPPAYVEQLRSLFERLRPSPPRQPSTYDVFVSKDLAASTHVFVRREGIRPGLTAPYDGPFEVLQRGEKTFTVSVNGRENVISIDRVKPAYMANLCVPLALPTRSPPDSPPFVPCPVSKHVSWASARQQRPLYLRGGAL
ncbi:uncharacterized protein [Dermacentor albipictus]|uniref:uncharacterized protein n=1 Tax=Dermacentor albipictus TaxID=60249 RepID=UPI0031FC4E8E